MSDWQTIIFYGVIAIVVIISLPAIINAIAAFVNGMITAAPAVNRAAKQICNIDNTILDSVVNSLETQNPIDPKIQNIIAMYKSGSKLTDCDVATLLSYLNDKEKIRLNIKDVICNAVNCEIDFTNNKTG